MRNIYLIVTLLILFVGCSSKVFQAPLEEEKILTKKENKDFYLIDEFIYKKDQIIFFEKLFDRIKKLENKETLQRYADFYRKNYSYFVNGLLKAKILEDKINQNKSIDIQDPHKKLLTKALSSNKEDAIKIYLQLAKEDNIFAQRELAEIYKIDDPIKSIYWYKKLISNNDIKSIKDYAYANIYMIRPIIIQDVKRAVELYESLEELGEVSTLMHLGNIYEYGFFKNDFPQDKAKALEYYKKAAKKDYTNAQKKLSKIYLCEKCVGNRFNKEEGIKLLKILISKGDKESEKILEKINLQTKEQEVLEEEINLEQIEESEK